VSAVNKTVQLVHLAEEVATAAAIGVAVLKTVTYLSANFGGPLTEDFL
jgi:hypothetical protein